MNPFAYLTRKIKEACAEGFRQFFAEIHPDNPPATLEELRALTAAPPPALPPADKTDAEEETPAKPARGRTK